MRSPPCDPTDNMNRLACFSVLFWAAALPAACEEIVFQRDIRPILKAHCFQCHGEDQVRESNLDLRLRRWIVQGGDSGPALVAGKPADSLLFQRIESGDMPPGDKSLPTDEIELIANWIRQGAKTARPEPESINSDEFLTEEEKQFWAFQPIQRPSVPGAPRADRIRSPIDAFVYAKLQAQQLDFSPPADRRTLIRRLYFDLIGLPPEPAAIEAYVNDASPLATRRLIDQLLASPEYAERWARHWLDIAGYADSEGYTEADRVRDSAFRYRDYVIRSFNKDKPIDQFIREQLAGDEMLTPPYTNLSEADIEKLTATGFLRMAPDGTASGGIDQNVARNQTIADTINIVSTSLLGLTVGCAQCHNHRYDPISQADYYRLRAVFEPALDWKAWRNPNARRVSLYTDAQREQKKAIEADVAKVEAERKEKTDFYINLVLVEELESVEESLREPLKAAYKTAAAKRTEEQKQLLKEHPSVQNISPGSLYLYDQGRATRVRAMDAERAKQLKEAIAQTRQAALDVLAADEKAAVLAAEKVSADKRNPTQTELLAKHAAVLVTEYTLSDFAPELASQLDANKQLADKLRNIKAADDLKTYTERINKIRQQIPPETFVRALTEPVGHRPETFLFHRGDHEQPRQKLEPSELAVLSANLNPIAVQAEGLPTTGRRLTYAENLTSRNHPLLARVIVNRIWAQHFGQGIVRSLGDFGTLGDRPTHPQLLDWLASELIDSGWQLKRIHRLILDSTTYQQSSTRTEPLDRADPDNLLYGRMSLRRLDSEVVRDSVLATAGILNRKLFGPPIPVREDDVGQIVIGKEMLDGERKPQASVGLGGEEYRRSLYVQVRRSRPLALLETFDAPRMTPNCTQRSASNVAPQPLLLMNSDFVIRRSRDMAIRVIADVGEDQALQIKRAWELALGVSPTDQQIADSQRYLQRQTDLLEQKEAVDVLATLCHALLSTNRFLYVD